ncbi:MAG: aminotransferase class IV, partial [Bacteroidota bacterium]
ETNATNVFMVRQGVLRTPTPDACLPGITRALVMELAKEGGIPLEETRISLAEFHAADEIFTTGTMGELTPVLKLDGRVIGEGIIGPITKKIQELFRAKTEKMGVTIPEW